MHCSCFSLVSKMCVSHLVPFFMTLGLSWSVNTTHHGLSLRFSGFSHKLQTLLHRVLESLLSINMQEGLFTLSKEKAIDAYRNIRLARPDEHCSIYLSLLLTEGRWDWRDKLERVRSLDLHDLASYHRQVSHSVVLLINALP